MKICVFGAGSIGGFLAASMADAGKDVSLIARGAHLAAIKQKGLTLQSKAKTFTVKIPASDNPADLGPQDLVIVSAKAPTLTQVAKTIKPLLKSDTIVAFAINGIHWYYGDGFKPNGKALDTRILDPEGALHKEIGVERTVGMIVRSPNEVKEPGLVVNGGGGHFVFGEATSRGGNRPAMLVEALSGCVFTLGTTTDIREEMWKKMVTNTAGLISALADSSSGQMANDPAVHDLTKAAMEETVAIAAAHGFNKLGIDIPGILNFLKTITGMKASIVQDLDRGRPMEIDALYVIAQNFARQAGVPTPVLDSLLPILILKAGLRGCYTAPKLAA